MQENLSIKFRKMKACSHEEGEDRKPSGGLDVCIGELSTSFISKESNGFMLLFQASKYMHG